MKFFLRINKILLILFVMVNCVSYECFYLSTPYYLQSSLLCTAKISYEQCMKSLLELEGKKVLSFPVAKSLEEIDLCSIRNILKVLKNEESITQEDLSKIKEFLVVSH